MATTIDGSALSSLRDLGFSEIEALVYAFLLQSAPATGYRISHAIGKPTANTYKAIAALVQQGAVQVDEGKNRLIRAVPPEELLGRLERRARDRRETARSVLGALGRDLADDRVYTLRDRDQVLERARAMLARAGEIVLGDLFPAPAAALAEDLLAAAARGVRIVVKTYAPCALPGVDVIAAPDGAWALAAWPGQQLSLVVDADEHLLAMFDAGLARVHQAVWSRSTFLSCLQHNHVAMELVNTAPERDLANITILARNPRGLQRLRERTGGTAPLNEGAGP
jgi:HTH-type transcriptional regulator, sugar sensing transcriptional regulator